MTHKDVNEGHLEVRKEKRRREKIREETEQKEDADARKGRKVAMQM